ncbi:hypothetical protein [Micromonospora sp. WMMD737]|uniref:hypothetical protein n=1 Tax=Micromonospora sp. WMMD737 TaxID=3404113 RepID=UPI003B94F3E8
MNLFPTKTRLRLLRDVADGMVWFSPHENAVHNRATAPAHNVLSATAEQRQAGWITVDIRDNADTLGHYPYRPTGTGWNLLAKHLPDAGPIPPVWLLDVDGVINATTPQWGCETSIGKARAAGTAYRLRWAKPLIDRIRELHTTLAVEVRWCTTWCAYADELERLWDLPALDRAFTDDINGYAASLAKLAAARQVLADGRRLIWTDDMEVPTAGPVSDELTDGGRSLLIRPDECYGLKPVDLDAIELFARSEAAEVTA